MPFPKIALAILLSGHCLFLDAQEQDISVKVTRYGVEHGLSQGSNYFTCKDSRGFHWFSSYEGLNRFDGRKFERFYPNPKNDASIQGSEVLGIVEDGYGNLWVGTEKCLNRYDRSSGKFSAFWVKDKKGGTIYSQTHPFYADSTEVWLANDHEGIVRYNFIKKERRLIDSTLKYKINYHFNFRVSPVRKGEFWMSQAKGLVYVNTNTGQRDWYFSNRQDNITGDSADIFAYAVAGKTAWIGLKKGLVRLDLGARTARLVPSPFNFSEHTIFAIQTDRAGRVWISAANHGVILYEPAKGKFRLLADIIGQSSRYAHTTVIAMNYEPGENILWANIEPDGLDKITLDVAQIHSLHNDPMNARGLNASTVRCFTEDRRGRIWIGVAGGGVNVFDPRTGRFEYHLSIPDNPNTLPDNTVLGMCTDKQGRVWAATERGVACYEESASGKGRWKRYRNKANTKDAVNSNLCMEVCALPGGRIAIGTATGVYILDPVTGLFSTVQDLEYFSEMARDMHFDEASGRLFITAHFKGFFIARQKGSGWKVEENHLRKFVTNCVYLPRQGGDTLWVGTGEGLARYNLASGQTELITVNEGLPSSCIYGILPDRSGRLWLSTNRGISCFDPASNTFENYSPADGCQNFEYNINGFYRSFRGELYFGGVSGFDHFYPEKLQRKHKNFPVYFTNFHIKNHPVSLDTVIGEMKRLELKHDENTFSIGFTALDWHNEGRITYRYRLPPYNPDWVVVSSEEEIARFVNVPPGNYRFSVQAASQSGEWSRQEAALNIVIAPAFWQTQWFRFAALSALGALLFLSLNFYFKTRYSLRLAAAEKAVEAERIRSRIAQDIHDEAGAGLTKISLAAQMAAQLPDLSTSEMKARLAKLATDARITAGSLREIVFAVNPDFDRFSELQAYFREQAREFWEDTETTVHFDFEKSPHDPIVPPGMKRELLLIFKEAQNNAAKHAAASNIWLTVKLLNAHTFLVEVRDDGCGMPTDKMSARTQGQRGMSQRAERIGAELRVESAPGAGVRVRMTGKI